MAFTDPIRLEKACAQVIADPEILSGTPVIRGTRVPVYDVAASVVAGIPMEEILASYPSLNRDQVELAALYAEANPPREGPRRRAAPPPSAKIISSRHKLRSRGAQIEAHRDYIFCGILNMKWTVETLNEIVDAEVEALPADMRARLTHIAKLIEEMGLERVGEPHVKHLDGHLWEMRLKGRSGISRALYIVATGKRVVIVRAFIKKTQKTPRHEIDLALSRAKAIA